MFGPDNIKSLRAPLYKFFLFKKEKFECPICSYHGPFKDKGHRKHAKCPSCGELERARMHFLVLQEILRGKSLDKLSILHFAPEKYLGGYFRKRAKIYVSADLYREDVNLKCDVQSIPCADSSFDLVFASHVLEYPENDILAMQEIFRVLGPDGVAILTVPLVHNMTVDRGIRHPANRMMHEPGLDYFKRMQSIFPKVVQFKSTQFPIRNQVNVYRGPEAKESGFPLEISPGVYADIVPVCYKYV